MSLSPRAHTYSGGGFGALPAPGRAVAPGAPGSTGSSSSWPHSGRLGGKGTRETFAALGNSSCPKRASPGSPERDPQHREWKGLDLPG